MSGIYQNSGYEDNIYKFESTPKLRQVKEIKKEL